MHPHEGNGSPEDRRLQIVVAGGSIGGLCAGLALHGSGFDVNVYERHPGPMDTRGAGIVVQGELVQLLDTYGAPPLPTTSCRVRRYLDPQGGDGQVQSMPQAFTSWEAIYETLRAAFPKERYHMGATLVGVNDPGDGQAVSAEIEGHGHIKTDLLVCADGAQSPTRRRLLPDVQSIYAGYVAWRGTLDEADAPKELVRFFEDAFTFSAIVEPLERQRMRMRVFLITGAGVSAESGLGTFRDKDGTGIWTRFDPMKLATAEAFVRDPQEVHAFYNARRRNLITAKPNAAHFALARLETALAERGGNLTLVTQNIDDLHERAGSECVIHMHGELLKARCQLGLPRGRICV